MARATARSEISAGRVLGVRARGACCGWRSNPWPILRVRKIAFFAGALVFAFVVLFFRIRARRQEPNFAFDPVSRLGLRSRASFVGTLGTLYACVFWGHPVDLHHWIDDSASKALPKETAISPQAVTSGSATTPSKAQVGFLLGTGPVFSIYNSSPVTADRPKYQFLLGDLNANNLQFPKRRLDMQVPVDTWDYLTPVRRWTIFTVC